ncbi:GNAT family N-acetyltransferase [Bacillus sp. CECT 9360]|uniref:GNAT family N-acetyltransferase n=1 Tax=Bacillus sp. CECT 9360 TaxID=2845821 RepID=UPI001E364D78|nr:GNAT family N-acetyltransferase [Bacillus sp. CECT 9360]CAH0346254.1 dTDP-fucosamine acetyltransferase [Bacillus sp. CECT 9360]
MIIRKAVPDEAENLLKLLNSVDGSNFMLYGPGERKTSIEEQSDRIKRLNDDERSEAFVADHNGELDGYLLIIGNMPQRIRHTIYLVVGVSERSRGKGIGTMLFEAMEKWAKQHKIHRMELTVLAHNLAALSLYRKMGFEIEGTKRDSLYMDGKYVDEYYMSKLLLRDPNPTGIARKF